MNTDAKNIAEVYASRVRLDQFNETVTYDDDEFFRLTDEEKFAIRELKQHGTLSVNVIARKYLGIKQQAHRGESWDVLNPITQLEYRIWKGLMRQGLARKSSVDGRMMLTLTPRGEKLNVDSTL